MDTPTRGRRGTIVSVAVLLVAAVTTAGLALWVDQGSRRLEAQRLDNLGDRTAFVLRNELDRYVAAGAGVAAAMSRELDLPPDAYDQLLEVIVTDQDLSGLLGMNAAVLVPDDEVEAWAERETALQPAMDVRLAEGTARHAILARVWPRTENLAALGFDVYDNPDAGDTVERTFEVDGPQMTDALVLRQAQDREDGLVVYQPIRIDARIVGWVGVVMQGQELLEEVAGELGVLVRATDATPDGPRLLGTAGGRPEDSPSGARASREIDLYGQTWTLELAPLVARDRTAVWLVAAIGALATAVLGAMVLVVARSERRALSLVAQRTADLAHVNETLAATNADLTETNRELARVGRAKDDLVSAVSHELRTPLTVIRGFASNLLTYDVGSLPPNAAQALERIDRHAHRLDRVVSEMLLTARIANGEESPTPSVVAVRSHLELLVAQVPEVDGLDVTVEGDREVRARTDPAHLSAVATQLLTNAAKYGAAPIVVRVEQDRDGVEVAVTDAGPGVPAEVVPTLFDRFTQGETGNARSSQGVGLGLWIVRQLAVLNGGDAEYRVAEQAFVVRLPVAWSEHRSAAEVEA